MDHQAIAELLGNYGEFVAAIAVVITLAYLAIQIRQNTRTASLTRGQAAQAQLAQLHERVMENKDLADLVARCRSGKPEDLTPGEDERLRRVANFYINSYAQVENAYRRGELDDRAYNSYSQDFRRTLSEYPGLGGYMRAIMEQFDVTYYRIVGPLFE